MGTPERLCERCTVTGRFNQTFIPTGEGYRIADFCPLCRRALERIIDRFTRKRPLDQEESESEIT